MDSRRRLQRVKGRGAFMGYRLLSGFYLGKKTSGLLVGLLGALLLALVVLGTLYGRCARKHEEEGLRAATPAPHDSSTPTPGPSDPWDQPRLPADLAPLHYSLLLWPLMAPGLPAPRAHRGQVNITLRCRRDTPTVLLHSASLTYQSAAVWGPLDASGSRARSVPVAKLWLAPLHQYAVLELGENLSAGALYELRLTFQGHIEQSYSHGLFLITYDDEGETRILIASSLQPIGARSVYPCFDEPAMKATFNISIIHHSSYVALSNMPAVDISEYKDLNESTLGIPRNWTVTTFGTTPKMSTYITAFLICNFDHVTTTERANEIRIWAKKDTIRNGIADYALNITGQLFSFMEDLLNVSYPLPKTDLIALPSLKAVDTASWGLITIQELHLLHLLHYEFESDIIVNLSKRIAQQWFGNLVTMDWWNEIWLSEGFTTYFAHLGCHYIKPEQSMSKTLNRDIIFFMLGLEGRIFLIPVTDGEATQRIPKRHIQAYLKAAAIVQMLSSFMTERLFYKALNSYLNAFSFSNVIQDDLWHHVQKVMDEQNELQLPAPVTDIMDSWTYIAGSPLLTLNVSTGSIKQELFHTWKKPGGIYNETWIVPIPWMRNGTTQTLIWLDKGSKMFPEMKISETEPDWILLNVNATGYYRTNYDQLNWRKLAKALERNPKMIPAINRYKLMKDASELSRLGYTEYDTPLYLTKYLEKEDDIAVWGIALYFLQSNDWRIIQHDYDASAALKKYLLPRISPIYHCYAASARQNHEVLNTGNILESHGIEQVIGAACWLGLPDCLELASEICAKWMNNPNYGEFIHIPKIICCYGVQMGSDKEWDLGWKMYNHANIKGDKNSLFFALSCTQKTWLLQRFLQYTFNSRSSERILDAVKHIARTDVGYSIAWRFVTDNWSSLYRRYGIAALNDLMLSAKTDAQVQMIELFLNNTLDTEERITATNKLKAAISIRDKKKESIARMIKWLQENMDE